MLSLPTPPLSLSSAWPCLSISLQFLPPAFVTHLCLQFSSHQRPLQLSRFPHRRPPATVTAQPPSHCTPITIALCRSLILASAASISSDDSVSRCLLSRRFCLSLIDVSLSSAVAPVTICSLILHSLFFRVSILWLEYLAAFNSLIFVFLGNN